MAAVNSIVATIKYGKNKFCISGRCVKILKFNDIDCNLIALLDMGSPISFIALKTCQKFFNVSKKLLVPVRGYRSFQKHSISILGKIQSTLVFENLHDRELEVTLHVVEKNLDDFDVLIGCDFIDSNNLILVYQK